MRITNPFQRSTPARNVGQPAQAQGSNTAQLPRPDGLTSRMLRRTHSDEAAQSGLVHAVAGQNTAAAAHFQAAGADPNVPTRDSLANVLPGSLVPPRGPTAMHVAAGAGMDGSQIRQLMNPGPGGGLQGNPNVRLPATRLHGRGGVRDDTPLHIAARAGNPAAAGELLAHPMVDAHARNARGQRPIDVAQARLDGSHVLSAEEQAAARTVVDQLQTHGTRSGLQETGVISLDPPPYADHPAWDAPPPGSPGGGSLQRSDSMRSVHSFSQLQVAGGQGGYQPSWMRNTHTGDAEAAPGQAASERRDSNASARPEGFDGAHAQVFAQEDQTYVPGRGQENPPSGGPRPSGR
jgi:hypothetical protein